MRDAAGENYLTIEEVIERYKWGSSTLYLFRSQGLLKSYKFRGDKKSYWKLSELEAVYHRPPEASKRGPKPRKADPDQESPTPASTPAQAKKWRFTGQNKDNGWLLARELDLTISPVKTFMSKIPGVETMPYDEIKKLWLQSLERNK